MNEVPIQSLAAKKGTMLYCETHQGYVIDSIENGGILKVLPKQDSCQVTIFQHIQKEKILLGTILFLSKNPPQPEFVLYKNGKRMRFPSGVLPQDSLEIRVIPDSIFAKTMPKEANYLISKVSIWSVTHAIKPCFQQEISEMPIKLPANQLGLAKYGMGTMFRIEGGDVYRINSIGEKIAQPVYPWGLRFFN